MTSSQRSMNVPLTPAAAPTSKDYATLGDEEAHFLVKQQPSTPSTYSLKRGLLFTLAAVGFTAMGYGAGSFHHAASTMETPAGSELVQVMDHKDALDTQELYRIKNNLWNFFDNCVLVDEDGTTCQAKALRLIFHDCAGQYGCDGCINVGLEENAGLEQFIKLLWASYRNMPCALTDKFTWADYVAYASVVASEMASAGNIPDRPMFQWGRWTNPVCNQGMVRDSDYNIGAQCNDVLGWPEARRVMGHSEYGMKLDDDNIAAILGVHALGMTHEQHSGFDGPWKNPHTTLDNIYYRRLLYSDYHPDLTDNGKQYWECEDNCDGGDSGIIMLNMDMSLRYEIEPDENGLIHCVNQEEDEQPGVCTEGDCFEECELSFIIDETIEYAEDGPVWDHEFTNAIEIMMNHAPYANLQWPVDRDGKDGNDV